MLRSKSILVYKPRTSQVCTCSRDVWCDRAHRTCHVCSPSLGGYEPLQSRLGRYEPLQSLDANGNFFTRLFTRRLCSASMSNGIFIKRWYRGLQKNFLWFITLCRIQWLLDVLPMLHEFFCLRYVRYNLKKTYANNGLFCMGASFIKTRPTIFYGHS